MPKVWNKRDKNVPKDAVYVGRPSRWGNPFKIDSSMNREEAIKAFKDLVTEPHDSSRYYRQNVREHLRGKDLVCWCAPKACHANILLEIANA